MEQKKVRRNTRTRIVGSCRRCGDEVLEGDFCYRIGGGFWCRECVNRAAVIAAAEFGCGNRDGFRVLGSRQVGRYRERELAVGMTRKGW